MNNGDVNPTSVSNRENRDSARLSVSSLYNSANEEDDRSSLTLWHQSCSPLAKRKANSFCGIFNRLLCTTRRNIPKTSSNLGLSSVNGLNGCTTTTTVSSSSTQSGQRVSTVQQSRRTPQQIYYESRGQSCRKLLKFNGNSNKVFSLSVQCGGGHLLSYSLICSFWTIDITLPGRGLGSNCLLIVLDHNTL